MMAVPDVVRFFTVVPVVPTSMLTTLFLVTAAGCAAIAVDVANAVPALAPILLLQLFAAASGFRVPARRGHYDLLFTRGERRATIVLTHFTMSILPGVLAWIALAATEQAGGAGTLRTSGTVMAVVLVSAPPWSLTMPFARLSGAIGWLLLYVVAGAALSPGGTVREPLLPWRLVGVSVPPALLATLIVAAVAGVGCVVGWVRTIDFPLEASQ
jgi:hypothetical protein